MTGGGRIRDRLGRVPAELTSLLGRRQDVAEVRRLLSGGRLVTLTGTAGSGKSRLGVRVANELRRAFADGVWLVDLASVSDPALVPYAVAEELGLQAPPADLLPEYLRDRELLLVLDNCEHLVDACAEFVDRVLRTAARVRVLCTSRHVLGMVAEYVWDVAPLAVPEAGVPYEPGVLGRYPGIALFVERGAAIRPGFALDAGTWPTVAEICRQLDGLPLAIELAAAQLRTLSLGQLAGGLFATAQSRHAVPARHRRLDAAFDWSFALCSPREQVLWQRLSVFTGPFDLASAEYVFEDSALELVAGLIEKSVLRREERADGIPRYRLLETVRRYGLDRLRATYGEAEEQRLRDRHRDWYVALAERLDADWLGPRQREWADRLHAEYGNIRAVLEEGIATETGAGLAAALRFYWFGCGAGHEGRYWLERALAANPRRDVVRMRALQVYATILIGVGDTAAAEHAARECLAIAEDVDDPVWRTRAVGTVGVIQVLQGDLAGGVRTLESVTAELDPLPPNDFLVAWQRLCLAMAASFLGNRERAAQLCARGRAASAAIGDRWFLAHVLTASAHTVSQAEALGFLREALGIRRELDDEFGAASAIERLAWFTTTEGDYPRAARLFGAADRLWRAVGGQLWGAAEWLRRRDECIRICRQALGDGRFEALVGRGAQLTTAEAIRYALDEADPVPAVKGTDVDGSVLTPRERQVAQLIAKGLSNQQIAARLVTSPRTAESHVQNILRKLDFASRAQVAAWVAGQSFD